MTVPSAPRQARGGEDSGSWLPVLVPVFAVLAVVAAVLGRWVPADRAEPAAAADGPQVIENSLGMRFVAIPPGRFTMGTLAADLPASRPLRTVTVAGFWFAQTEVTQQQWWAIMGYNPSAFPNPGKPVEQVSWYAAQQFIEKLNQKERSLGRRYRLPAEAEWEYAARAGRHSAYFFGDTANMLAKYAWFGVSGGVGTRPVGQRAANPWGLYDIYGNVWEWMQDCWHDDYKGAPQQAIAWQERDCRRRVLRGGGWNSPASRLRSAARGSLEADLDDMATGLRLVMEIQDNNKAPGHR